MIRVMGRFREGLSEEETFQIRKQYLLYFLELE